jgi:hypothetical protein
MFIDFKQAFDTVDIHKIMQILQELSIPNKLVRLIKMTIQNTEARVKTGNLTFKPFLISPGMRQGNPLSTTISNLMLDLVITELNLRGEVSLKLTQILLMLMMLPF